MKPTKTTAAAKTISSMVNSVVDYLIDAGIESTSDYTAYDLIKSNFRSNAPSEEIFNQLCEQAIKQLKSEGKIRQ